MLNHNSAELLSASIKEACLLAMLRVAAECEELPSDIIPKVNKAAEVSGKHLRRV